MNRGRMWSIILSACLVVLIEGNAHAYAITNMGMDSTNCNGNPFLGTDITFSGPGITEFTGDIGGCLIGAGVVRPNGFHPGDTVGVLLQQGGSGQGTVDGITTIGRICPGFGLSCVAMNGMANFSVLIPLDSQDNFLTLEAPATVFGSLQLFDFPPTVGPQSSSVSGTGTGTLILLGNQCVESSVCYSPGQVHINLTITPEPAAWLLLGSGLIGLAVWRRKKLDINRNPMKTLTLLIILLAALCLAPPAWADSLPILTGEWGLAPGNSEFIDVTTSQFTVFNNNDGPTFGTYQGVMYCATQAGFGVDCATGQITSVPPGPIGASWVFGYTPPPTCPVLFQCADMTVPAHLAVFVNFLVNGQFIGFTAMGDGVALSREGVGVYHAYFGSAIPTPEPNTWLLLGSGLVGLAVWRRKKAA